MQKYKTGQVYVQDLPKCAFANFKTSIGSAENNNGCSKILKNIKNINNNNKKSRDSKLNALIFYECASFITTNCFYICLQESAEIHSEKPRFL